MVLLRATEYTHIDHTQLDVAISLVSSTPYIREHSKTTQKSPWEKEEGWLCIGYKEGGWLCIGYKEGGWGWLCIGYKEGGWLCIGYKEGGAMHRL